MKWLLKYVEKIKPTFSEGGKLPWLHSTFDAFETFLFVPATTTRKGAHIRDCNDMKRSMIIVVLALMPALLFGMYNVGLQHFKATGEAAAMALGSLPVIWKFFWFGFLKVLPIIIVSYVVGLGIEFAFAQMRRHEVNEGFLVTGMLIPLIVPVDIPLWMVALATAFSVIICKEVFGGTGMNVFNPALVARAFIFFAYTPFISGEKVWVAGMTKGTGIIDSFSGATPLSDIGNAMAEGAQTITYANGTTPLDWFLGFIPGSIGETSTVAILLGAILLLITGVASWRIMLSVFAGGYLMGLLFNLIGANMYMADVPAWQHLILGGFAFGAVFMATDPVTASQTNTGKIIVGLLIGAVAVMVRVVNPGYPEGMMLSILLMNALAPLIDHYVVEANIRRRNRRLQTAK
ncbi:MAG: NADH:ubiquinone reductase (Na(+)-transporting) subunit B [Rikenellaceae bacterium]|jgi:Na+-transporting NADH:ubiquinone oxidoreductase subunit B|nr:NADH:ubiquinone reductase (Na(+)-transporting) subunit B [Rikenellaceae bacterium]